MPAAMATIVDGVALRRCTRRDSAAAPRRVAAHGRSRRSMAPRVDAGDAGEEMKVLDSIHQLRRTFAGQNVSADNEGPRDSARSPIETRFHRGSRVAWRSPGRIRKASRGSSILLRSQSSSSRTSCTQHLRRDVALRLRRRAESQPQIRCRAHAPRARPRRGRPVPMTRISSKTHIFCCFHTPRRDVTLDAG
jgi:hypothetical protein